MNLTINDIEDWQESEKLSDDIKKIINILLAAINDWPKPIATLAEYEIEISKLIGSEADKINIKEYISKADYSLNAWETESLFQILEVFTHYENEKTLKQIIEEIENKIEIL
ncbi:hypothetical protein [uncultured Algoriphagus sp.]|uniref:hypothetical protein n=1 Tax=uncultured Algoriphagus sp. TaxID=417365 RepID=UPI0030EDEA5E|tara:strand:+ start:23485 stop:23820 length:336 start_codon:yes stop_codon:yes gene_type:complete